MQDKVSYINYVKTTLDSIPSETICKASYDAGFGLHITNEHLGDAPMTMFVVGASVAKVLPPNIKDNDEWDSAWKEAKRLVNEYVAKSSIKRAIADRD